MENLIKQQLFALDMEALASQMRRLQLQDRVVTLLDELWDNVCHESIPRKTVESTWEETGMEFTIGELKVPTFYFLGVKKFWRQLNRVLQLRIRSDYWIKVVIQQTFLHDWCMEPFTPWCVKKLC